MSKFREADDSLTIHSIASRHFKCCVTGTTVPVNLASLKMLEYTARHLLGGINEILQWFVCDLNFVQVL